MASKDPILGKKIHQLLLSKGIETPLAKATTNSNLENELGLQDACSNLVKYLGLDMTDDSIKDTPTRLQKMFSKEICYGLDYKNFPACSTFENKYKCDELVAEKVTIKSL